MDWYIVRPHIKVHAISKEHAEDLVKVALSQNPLFLYEEDNEGRLGFMPTLMERRPGT